MTNKRTINKEQILVIIQSILNERDHCIALGNIGMTSDVDVTAGLEEAVFEIMRIPYRSNYIRISDGEKTLGTDDFYPLVFDDPKNAIESYEALLKIKSEYREDIPIKASNF